MDIWILQETLQVLTDLNPIAKGTSPEKINNDGLENKHASYKQWWFGKPNVSGLNKLGENWGHPKPYVLVFGGHISKLLGGDIWSDQELSYPFWDAPKKSKPGANFSCGDIVLLDGIYMYIYICIIHV